MTFDLGSFLIGACIGACAASLAIMAIAQILNHIEWKRYDK